MIDPNILLEKLRAGGYRLTVARKAIVEILAEGNPLSAIDIHVKLQNRNIKTDKVTIYREIEFLETQGILIAVQFQDRHRRYELASLGHHHHLICEKCEKVEDIQFKENFHIQERDIARQKNFKVLRHSLEFFGLCQRCQ